MTPVNTAPIELPENNLREPHAVYQGLRDQDPVCQVFLPGIGLTAYMVSAQDHIRSVLTHPNVSKEGGANASEPFTHHMLNYDPPTHTRLRAVVNRSFRPSRIGTMRSAMSSHAQQMVDALASEIDLIDDFAYPFTMSVLRELLGVTDHEDDDFRQLAEVLITEVTPDRRAEAATRMTECLTRLIIAKRDFPGNDLLTRLLTACDIEGILTEDEVLATVFLLLVAGHETTVSLIGNSVWALLLHPDQLAALVANPSLVGSTVDEVLRWVGPAGVSTLRHTTGPVTVGDTTIPPHEFVLLALESAGLDSRHYPDPERFDIRRNAGHGMAFGHGIHHCLGSALAKLEGEVAISHLILRYPGLTCLQDPATLRWRPNIVIRGLERLPVRLSV